MFLLYNCSINSFSTSSIDENKLEALNQALDILKYQKSDIKLSPCTLNFFNSHSMFFEDELLQANFNQDSIYSSTNRIIKYHKPEKWTEPKNIQAVFSEINNDFFTLEIINNSISVDLCNPNQIIFGESDIFLFKGVNMVSHKMISYN